MSQIAKLARFQFQTGSIRSVSLRTNSSDRFCFNSKLVRLEVHRSGQSQGFPRFNSKLVRLEVTLKVYIRSNDGSFNSKLVRLEGR